MKRTLYLKLLGGYLLFGLLGFLIIATFTYHLTFQHLEKKEAQNLYRESALISSSYAQNYFSNSMTLDEINEQLNALGTYLNADIWIVLRRWAPPAWSLPMRTAFPSTRRAAYTPSAPPFPASGR